MKKLKLILLTVLLAVTVQPAALAQCNPADSGCLVEFYNSTNGPNWVFNTNWLTGPVSSWEGIYLTPTDTQFVEAIDLGYFNINNNLSGTLPSCLCNLQFLHTLSLYNNNLSGPVPYCLSTLPKLSNFELAKNQFTGPLPPLFKMSQSTYFMIGIQNNQFSGPFPDTIMMNPNLTTLHIQNNKFTSIRYYPGNPLTSMPHLSLEDNCFTFQHLIPFKQNVNPNWNSYYPQDSILELLDTLVQTGSTLVLDSWIDTCSQNKYAWRKNGTWLNWNSTDSYWTINNIQHSDTGLYTCQVTNPQLWGLALQRRMIRVRVTDTLTGLPETRPEQDAIRIRWFQQQVPPVLKLSFNLPQPQRIHASLINTEGQQVRLLYHGDARQRELGYTLDDLQAGLYLVRIMTPEGTVTKKIVVQ